MCGYTWRTDNCGTHLGAPCMPPSPCGISSLTGTFTHLPALYLPAATTVFSSPAKPIGEPDARE